MNKKISVKTRVLIILLAIFVFLVAALSVSICMFVKADNVAAQAERLERVVDSWQFSWLTKAGNKAFYKMEFNSIAQ